MNNESCWQTFRQLRRRSTNPSSTGIIFDGYVVNPFDVHMEAGPFSDPDAGDTHSASEWEIWTNAGVIERVWSSTQIGTVEMVHVHLGDGTFENTHAGRVDLLPETDYQLRVRFRDSSRDESNHWSAYSFRDFTTGPLSQTFPLETEDIISVPPVSWVDTSGSVIVLSAGSPAPSISLESAAGELLLRIDGTDGSVNAVTNPPELPDHIDVRVRINAGDDVLFLPQSNLSFTNDDGKRITIYLPAISLAPGTEERFWISQNGSTFESLPTQTEPDFSEIARGTPAPWTVAEGYRVEVVATGFQLPVNIAFVPNPGTNPNDPLYYVTELYGTIKVVTRDGTVRDFVTDLLNFDPTVNLPGSGEQGLSGFWSSLPPVMCTPAWSSIRMDCPMVNSQPHRKRRSSTWSASRRGKLALSPI